MLSRYLAIFENIVSFTKQIQNRAHAEILGPIDCKERFTSISYPRNHGNSKIIKQIMHLHLQMLVKSMKIDLGWCFSDPTPVLWMPGGLNKPPDSSIHARNFKNCPKTASNRPMETRGYQKCPQIRFWDIHIYHGYWPILTIAPGNETQISIYVYFLFRWKGQPFSHIPGGTGDSPVTVWRKATQSCHDEPHTSLHKASTKAY